MYRQIVMALLVGISCQVSAMSESVELLLNEARAMADAGEWQSAIRYYYDILDRANPEVRLELAQLLLDIQSHDPYAEDFDFLEALLHQRN